MAHDRRRQIWEPLTNGLPQHDAHLTVLRDGFTTDGLDPAGLYFGTRTGSVYASNDDGDSWQLLAENLPPVMSVRAAPIAERLTGDRGRRVRVPTQLRELVGRRARGGGLQSTGRRTAHGATTVAQVLDVLATMHPALERRIRDEQGQRRTHVNLFVDGDNVRDCDGLATPIHPGQELTILAAVSGG